MSAPEQVLRTKILTRTTLHTACTHIYAPSVTHPLTLGSDRTRFTRGLSQGWDIDALLSDFDIVKQTTVTHTRQGGSELIDRYYIYDGEKVCLMGRRKYFEHGLKSCGLFLNNVNGLLFQKRQTRALPLEAISPRYVNTPKAIVPCFFKKGDVEDYETILKDGFYSDEESYFFNSLDDLSSIDILGSFGWRPVACLDMIEKYPTILQKDGSIIDQEIYHVLSQDCQWDTTLKSILAKSYTDLSDMITAAFLFPEGHNALHSVEQCKIDFIKVEDAYEVKSYKAIHPLTSEIITHHERESTSTLNDAINEWVWEQGLSVPELSIIRSIDDIVMIVFYDRRLTETPIGSLCFPLFKRMVMNYGVISASNFNGEGLTLR